MSGNINSMTDTVIYGVCREGWTLHDRHCNLWCMQRRMDTHLRDHVTRHMTKFFNGEMYKEPSFLPCRSAIPKVSMPLESPLGIDSECFFNLTQPLGA